MDRDPETHLFSCWMCGHSTDNTRDMQNHIGSAKHKNEEVLGPHRSSRQHSLASPYALSGSSSPSRSGVGRPSGSDRAGSSMPSPVLSQSVSLPQAKDVDTAMEVDIVDDNNARLEPGMYYCLSIFCC